MEDQEEQNIIAQEWVVMFDGQIKRSEKIFDGNLHHLEINRENNK